MNFKSTFQHRRPDEDSFGKTGTHVLHRRSSTQRNGRRLARIGLVILLVFLVTNARHSSADSLLTLAAGSVKSQLEPSAVNAGMALQNARHPSVLLGSSVAEKRLERPKFLASKQCVGGHEIAGFSAKSAEQQQVTPPAALKPVEQEAWLAMARRLGASGGSEFSSFYPKRYNEPFVVDGHGVRVAVRPLRGTDVAAQIDNGQVIYRGAYPETDSMHAVSAERSEEFLFLQDQCAPHEFEYELSELSAGTRVELLKGEVHFTDKAGHGLKIEAPWLIDATGEQRAGAVRWELEESKSGAPQRL
jgi:hypothetical protein